MKRYDPLKAPDPQAWLALDEEERISLARQYHIFARIKVPNVQAHAVAHALVENQIALGDEIPVARTLRRLMAEGLDRHDAVHAIGFVLLGYMNNLLKAADAHSEPAGDPNLAYFAELELLTAESWRQSGVEQ